jgi:alpha-ketoglutarate-dependent taurine dioxygenase
MAITVDSFAAGLGANVSGANLRTPVPAEDREQLRQAWRDHLVLRFREQPMSDEEHMAFTRNFGELECPANRVLERDYGMTSARYEGRRPSPPEISVISNIIENGKPIGGLGSGEAAWHTDSSFLEIPPAGSALRALEIPPEGGSTYFLNMYSAFEALPDALRQRIAGMQAIHSIMHTSDGAPRKGFEHLTITDPSQVPGARHPLVRTHPETGRKALFLGRRLGAYVLGLSLAESEALLDELWSYTLKDRFIWRQDWKVGDLVLWDNRCAMHRRDPFDPATRREMHRTQLKGDRPV